MSSRSFVGKCTSWKVYGTRQTSVPNGGRRGSLYPSPRPPFSLLPALLSSCEYEILPEGYPIAEREYKNRINRVYDVAKGEGNAAEANRFWGFRDEHLAKEYGDCPRLNIYSWFPSESNRRLVHVVSIRYFGAINVCVSRVLRGNCSFGRSIRLI